MPNLQELFKEGNLIARALPLDIPRGDDEYNLDLSYYRDEMHYLNRDRVREGDGDIERRGQRNRSATLLVEDVVMSFLIVI